MYRHEQKVSSWKKYGSLPLVACSNFQVIAKNFRWSLSFWRPSWCPMCSSVQASSGTLLSWTQGFESKADYKQLLSSSWKNTDWLGLFGGLYENRRLTLLALYEGRIINIHPAYLPEFPGLWNWGCGMLVLPKVTWLLGGLRGGYRKVIKQVRVPRCDDTVGSFRLMHETEYPYPEVLDSSKRFGEEVLNGSNYEVNKQPRNLLGSKGKNKFAIPEYLRPYA